MPPRPKRASTQPVPDPPQTTLQPPGAPSAGASLYEEPTLHSGDTFDILLSDLCPNPFNKREMKGIPELARAIEEVGLLQDISHIQAEVWLQHYPETRDKITAKHVILFGEHRWRAHQHLGRKTISSVLHDDKVADAQIICLIENLRRAQLAPLEEAEQYKELRDKGLSYERIAERVGETEKGAVSKGTIWKRVQLLDLDPELQTALRQGELGVGAAQRFLRLPTPAGQRKALELVRAGSHAEEAYSQASTVRPEETAPAAGKDDAEPDATDGRGVSDGNTEAAVATASKPKKTKRTPRQRKNPEGEPKSSAATPPPDDRTVAATARDVACRRLIKTLDLTNPEGREVLVRVFTTALLVPSQQGPVQERAYRWLVETELIGQEEAASASTYFAAAQASTDPRVRERAAFVSALAAAELRTANRLQSWRESERDHVRLLMEHADYAPETHLERAELGDTNKEKTA